MSDHITSIIPHDQRERAEPAVSWTSSRESENGHGVIREPLITWLASYPKSGNTWLRAFLTAYKTGESVDINQMGVVGGDDLNPFHYQNVIGKPWQQMTQFETMAVRSAALLQLMHTYASVSPLFVKTHMIVGKLSEFPTIPVGLTRGAVYIMRDPRDVALSLARHNGGSVDDAVKQMGHPRMPITRDSLFHAIGSWSLNVETWAAASSSDLNVRMVRYEDLLSMPMAYFEKTVAHVGWTPDPARLEFAIEASCFTELQAQEASNGFRERRGEAAFFHSGREGGWREELTDEQVAKIEADHGKTMARMGYELVTKPSVGKDK